MTLSVYNRRISGHNADEYEKVQSSMEVWGKSAHVLAHGVCVQAYPGAAPKNTDAYSFSSGVPARPKLGFRGKITVIREVVWSLDMPGVEERENGAFAAIAIDWCEKDGERIDAG